MAIIFLDLGSTYSYVFVIFYLGLNLVCDVLDSIVYVSNPMCDPMVVTHRYHTCLVLFMGFKTWVDLIIF